MEPMFGIIIDGLSKRDAIRPVRYRNDGGAGIVSSDGFSLTNGQTLYPGSSITNSSQDFLGDWRSLDAFHRLDLPLVRRRSRQLEWGNDMCKALKRNMVNNVLGHKGFHQKYLAATSKAYGDNSDGVIDTPAVTLIQSGIEKQHLAENLTTRKRLSERELDALLLSRLIFDGQFILIKRKGFKNDCNFAWQMVNSDYLDVNLNRLEANGNMTRMGVELDKDDKFPVAYWFLLKRPNDSQFNYNQVDQKRYTRVDAADVIHVFLQTEDEEQTQGFPWIFAAMVNLWRSGRFQEAALINATIGASKGLVYEKDYPEGFLEYGGDIDTLNQTDCGQIVDKVQPSSGYELPFGVHAKQVDYRFPDAVVGPFLQAMNMGIALAFGTSYATTTGDLSNANFVSSRLGQLEEREHYMAIQEFLIEKWKKPQADEELYRGMLSRTIPLPISKFDKFNKFEFVGRRWPFVQPVDDLTAKIMALDNNLTSITDIITETTGESRDDMFAKIKADNEAMAAAGIARVHGTYQFVLSPSANPAMQPGQTIVNPPQPNAPTQPPPTP